LTRKNNHIKEKEIKYLFKKEKQLHKEIRQDYKKISEKIISDFNQIQKLKIK